MGTQPPRRGAGQGRGEAGEPLLLAQVREREHVVVSEQKIFDWGNSQAGIDASSVCGWTPPLHNTFQSAQRIYLE